jgi:L-malate glycosyltransferase
LLTDIMLTAGSVSEMRVCMCIRNFRPVDGAGIQLQLARLLPKLQGRGVHPVVLSGRSVGFPRRELLSGVPVRRASIPGPGRAGTASYTATVAGHLLRNREETDVVHVHGGRHAAGISAVARRAGIPVVVKVSRAGSHNDLKLLQEHRFGGPAFRHLRAHAWFIAQSSAVKKELDELGVPSDRIFAVPNGVDTRQFHPPTEPDERTKTRARYGLPEGALAMWTGRLEPMKKVETLVEALPHAPEVSLALVGGGSEQDRLAQLARDRRVSDRVFFVGPTREVAELLRAADLFVHPSASEGLANSLLEAMASGLPCIVSPVLDVPELGGENRGVLRAEEGFEGWASSIRSVVGDDGLRERLGQRALQVVTEGFTLEATAAGLVKVYETLSKETTRL